MLHSCCCTDNMASKIDEEMVDLMEKGESDSELESASQAISGGTRESCGPLIDPHAVQNKDYLKKVKEIKDASDDVQESFLLDRNDDGETPLHLACKLHDKDKQVEQLLECARTDKLEREQLLPEVDDEEMMDLMEKGESEPESASQAAASGGTGEICGPINPHAVQDKDYLKKVKEIKDASNDVQESFLLDRNDDGETPLHLACKLHDKDKQIVEQLLECAHTDELKMKQLLAKVEKDRSPEGSIAPIPRPLLGRSNNSTVAPKPKGGQNQPSPSGSTPLHIVAAGFCNREIVGILMKECDRLEILHGLLWHKPELKNKNTPVHVAAMKGNISMLNWIYNKKKYDKEQLLLQNEGKDKRLPLHYASGFGKLDVVKQLVKWDKSHKTIEALYKPPMPPFAETKEQTPLTKACYFGHHKVVEYLLEQGAEIHRFALIAAIQGKHYKCVKLLLSKVDNTEHLTLPYRPNSNSPVLTTAFHELIKHMPDMAEYVLNTQCLDITRHKVHSKNFQIKLKYELVNDDGQHWSKITKEEKQGIDEIKPSNDAATDTDTPTKSSFNSMTHPLSLMVEYKRKSLLTHPVVAALIHDKWNSRYGVFSFGFWLLYLIFFMCSANVLMQLLPHPNDDYCTLNTTNETSYELCSLHMTDMNCKNAVVPDQPSEPAVITINMLVLLYSAFRIVFEGFKMITSVRQVWHMNNVNKSFKEGKDNSNIPAKTLRSEKKTREKIDEKDITRLGKAFISFQKIVKAVKQIDYILDYRNWIELPFFVLAFIFSILLFTNWKENFCLPAWQWQIGVIILWLSWIEFIFLSIQFKLIGVYILMFIRILKSLLKLLPSALLLVAAFGLTFHFLLYQPNIKASPFFTSRYSFLKTISMTVGDVSVDDFFGLDIHGETRDTSHLEYMSLSTIFWIVSLFLLTILLSNLMIGLAVGDVQVIYKQAELEKLSLQVSHILSVESGFHAAKRQKNNKTNMKVVNPNKLSPHICETARKELIYLLWGGTRYDSQESVHRLLAARDSSCT